MAKKPTKKPLAAWDTNQKKTPDPRVDQLNKLVRELIIERAQMGMDCLKADDERAGLFFMDCKDAQEAFNKLLESLGLVELADKEKKN
jgi:hypothetical protein